MEFACTSCEKVYSSRQALSQHVRARHENVSYVCDKCFFGYTRITNLLNHKSSKAGARQCRLNLMIYNAKKIRTIRSDNTVTYSSCPITTTTNAATEGVAADPVTTTASSSLSTERPESPIILSSSSSNSPTASVSSSTTITASTITSSTSNSSFAEDAATVTTSSSFLEQPESPTTEAAAYPESTTSSLPDQPDSPRSPESPRSPSSSSTAADEDAYRYCEICNTNVKKCYWSYHLETRSHQHNNGIRIFNGEVRSITWGHYKLSNV